MGHRPDWPPIEPDKLGTDFSRWREGLAKPVQTAFDKLRMMLDRGLTADNMQLSHESFELTHDTEKPFKCPKFRPRGFIPLEATDSNGNAVRVVGPPRINFNRSDKAQGWYGLTAHFDNSGASTGSIGESASATVTQAGAAPLTTNVALQAVTLNLPSAGSWLVSGKAGFTTTSPPTGSRVVASINTANSLNAATEAQIPLMPVNGVADVSISPRSRLITVAAPTNVFMVCLATFTAGNVRAYGSLEALRTQPYLTGYAARVTGILWGM